MSASLTFTGTGGASYSVPVTHTAVSGTWVYDADGVGIISSGNFARLLDVSICSGVVSAEIEFTLPSGAAYWSRAGVVFLDAALNGVKIEGRGDAITVQKEVAGADGATIATFSTSNANSTFILKATLNTANGAIVAYKNGTQVLTATYTDFLSNLRAGMQTYRDNSTDIPVNTLVTVTGGASIDTLGDSNTTVRVGGTHSVATTGLGTLTTASTVGGKAIASASAPSGDGTITLAGFVSGQAYPAMGTQSCVMSDGTLTASANRTLDTMEGWQWVNVASLDSGDWSLGKAFSGGDTPTQLHVINDGTGVLNANGTLTDWSTSGVYTCWARMAAGGSYSGGEMVSFTFSVTDSGIVIHKKNSLRLGLGLSL